MSNPACIDTLPDLLDRAAAAGGEIHWEGQWIPLARLRERSLSVAHGLAAHGIGRGDRIGLCLPNSPDWLACFFACARLGAAVLVLNTRLTMHEIAGLMERSASQVLIREPGNGAAASGSDVGKLKGVRLVVEVGGTRTAPLRTDAAATTLAALEQHSPFSGDAAHGTDIAVIYSTSGSTGASKLVQHSQAGLAFHACNVVRHLQLDAPDTVHLVPLPLAGAYGLTQTLVAVASGRPLVLQAKFEPHETAILVKRHSVTHMYLFDDAIAQLLQAVEGEDRPFPSLRWCTYGIFNPSLKGLVADSEARGVALLGVYGSSETQAFFVTQNPLDPLELRTRAGGFPVSSLARFRIRDTETGEILGPGRTGEIEVAGPSLMVGYLGDTPASAHVLDDGFFRTGDSGMIAADGSLLFESRVDDVLRLSGYLVMTGEIEAAVMQSPEVAACVVVGVRIAAGNRPVAFVILRDGHRLDGPKLQADCASRLAKYKVPIAFHQVDAFPIGGSINAAKIDKKQLRARAAELHP